MSNSDEVGTTTEDRAAPPSKRPRTAANGGGHDDEQSGVHSQGAAAEAAGADDARCGWADGGPREAPAAGVPAGSLELDARRELLGVRVAALARRGEGGGVALEARLHMSSAVLFARVEDIDSLAPAERARAGVAPHMANGSRKKRRRLARAPTTRLALPEDSVAVGTAERGTPSAALLLALVRLQSKGHISVEFSAGDAALAAGLEHVRVTAAVRLLGSAFVDVHDAPDDHDTRDADLGLLLDAIAEREAATAAATAAAATPADQAGFSVHSFYESLRRSVDDSPASVPTPSGMACKLRPYQARAVAWMAGREVQPGDTQPLRTPHPLWSKLELPAGHTVWANAATGQLSMREAWHRQTTFGGILAEEMGLGKTVEVLALIMSRRCPAACRLRAQTPAELIRPPPGGASSAALRPVARLLEELKGREDAAAFLKPAVELFTPEEIPDYTEVVRRPMDLRTVETKLKAGAYKTAEACAGDVRQIWRNCRIYNHPSVPAYQCAVRLSQFFERRFRALTAQGDARREVPAEEKMLQGTLIIAPHSLLQQWRDEIARHAPELSLEVYAGLHQCVTFDEQGYARTEDLTKMKATDDFGAEELREQKRQARLLQLTKADIVLTTYQALRKEVHYASDFGSGGTRTLRHAKVYAVPTCPLLSFAWFRVVLDEAQMVESTTAATAQMALRIRARHRWCVTGTPVGARGVDDLHGLLLFLRHEPFSSKFWWERTLLRKVGQSPRAGMELLRQTLRPIMWRNSKAHVKDELGVPPMQD